MSCAALLATLLLAGDVTRPANEQPRILREIGFDQHLGESVPLDLPFRDEGGHVVRLSQYFGKRPVVLSLNYYSCPMLCTVSLNGLASAMDVIAYTAGREYEVVTVSFDPKETSDLAAQKKKTYLQRYKRPEAEGGWHFLTGDQEEIDKLTKAVGFRYVWDVQTKQFAHPAGILVLTPEGKISRYLFGIEYAPKDLRFALIDASEGKIGTVLDQAVLGCFQYDPTTGRYSASIIRIVRIGGALTLVALGTFVFLMLRRESNAPLPQGGRR